MNAAVKAVEKTANIKTGPVSVTMVSQASCDDSCPFKRSGCYSESGPQGIWTSKLNKADESDPDVLAQAEAEAIDTLSGERPMRLHVVGDCRTPTAADKVARAAERFTAKHGQPTWSYTHSWRTVDRSVWRGVSVLASVENVEDAKAALRRGYAPALVVGSFGTDKATRVDGVKLIPCPAQTRDNVQCVDCRLCWNDKGLVDRSAAIVFEAHGSGRKKIQRAVGA